MDSPLAPSLRRVLVACIEDGDLAWLDFRPLGLTRDPSEVLREHARLNFATSPAILRHAVHRIAAGAGIESAAGA